jgi:hypothetical protein
VKMASSSCARIPPDSTSAEAERALDLFGVYAARGGGGRTRSSTRSPMNRNCADGAAERVSAGMAQVAFSAFPTSKHIT